MGSIIGRKYKIDTQDVALQIAGIIGKHCFNTEHLHYGLWTPDLPVKLENIAQAQQNYTDFLFRHIPENVHAILDVGCGIGHNAQLLCEHNYDVECVSPSARLSMVVKDKLPNIQIYQGFFEKVKIERKFDMVLFSESFQYMKMSEALKKAAGLLNPGGVILITDFFRIPAEGTSPMGGGQRLSRFIEEVAAQKMTIVNDEDITALTAPNLQLVDEALQNVVMPITDMIKELLSTNYPWLYRSSMFVANLFWKKKLQKLHYKYLSGERNAGNFAKFKSYRLFLLHP